MPNCNNCTNDTYYTCCRENVTAGSDDCRDRQEHTHHPDDIAAGNLPTDTERAQGGDDDPPAERASDLIYDGIGLRARGGLVYFA